jgi:Tol biopolymer transport system component
MRPCGDRSTPPGRVFLALGAVAALLGCTTERIVVEAFVEAFSEAPSGTSAVAASETRIDLSWQDNSTNETGFEVHRSRTDSGGSGTFALLASTGAGLASYSDDGLDPSTDYCYKVRAVRATASGTGYSEFSATACATTPAPPPGAIRVTSATTGVDLDPDGYSVSVDGGAGVPIGANGAITISGLQPGAHTVRLDGVAANCDVTNLNPQTVSVTSGETAEVAFAVTCGQDNSIQVTAITTGVDLDPDGYHVQLWRRTTGSRVSAGHRDVVADGTATFSGLTVGEYEVEFSLMAVNCDPITANPLPVDLTSGGEAVVEFEVACAAVTQLAFANDVGGSSYDIYVINSNGTAETRLTMDPASDLDPAWSPDGSKIAFRSHRDGNAEIYVMDADGSNPRRLTDHTAADFEPAWSPDGTRIAFVTNRDGNQEIYAMNATDGSNLVRLTDYPAADVEPAWSPNGTQIAFQRDGDIYYGSDIYVMSADGSGITALTIGGVAAQPAWSPDGTKIAFWSYAYDVCSYYCSAIYIMNADGSGATRLTAGEYDSEPTWSPDGRWIAFVWLAWWDYSEHIRAVRVDGTRVEAITSGNSPAWRP